MRFSELSWFIREEIIKLVVEKNPKYCRVCKEWLILVAAKHGSITFREKPPEFQKPDTLFTQYNKKLNFYRITKIEWEVIYSKNNITDVVIFIDEEVLSKDCQEFITKFSRLPPLGSLKIYAFNVLDVNFSPLIKANQLHLKILRVSSKGQTWQPDMGKMTFSNLVHLDINFLRTIFIQDFINCMPRLKSLRVKFQKTKESTLFEDLEMPNLTKLELEITCIQDSIRVCLANMSNIKKLTLIGDFEFVGKYTLNETKELKASRISENSLDLMYSMFSNLSDLYLSLPNDLSLNNSCNFLNCQTSLKRVRLDLKCQDQIENLPTGPYAFTDLTLEGRFYVNHYLLRWLNSSFKLKKLSLHACRSEKCLSHEVPKFLKLNQLKVQICPRLIEKFRQKVNKNTHRHINSIEIKKCYCL